MKKNGKKVETVVREGSFLSHFAPSKPGTPRPQGLNTPGGIDMAAWNKARVARLTAPGPGQADY